MIAGDQFLGGVRFIEGLPELILARPGVVTTDDEMAATVVLADEGMPQRLARASHAHRQIEQTQGGGLLGIGFFQQVFVAAHPRIVIGIAGFGQTDRRVNQQIGLGLLHGAHGQFLMGAMHRVPGLERHDPPPAQLGEALAQFTRCIAQMGKIVMRGRFDTAQPTADIDRPGAVQQVKDARMLVIRGAENLLRFLELVRTPDIADLQYGDQHPLGIAQCDFVAATQITGEGFGYVEGDRYRPQRAVAQAHLFNDSPVISLIQKTIQG